MSRLAVAAVLPGVAAVCAVEVVRRGFAAPIITGAYGWYRALGLGPDSEADPVG